MTNTTENPHAIDRSSRPPQVPQARDADLRPTASGAGDPPAHADPSAHTDPSVLPMFSSPDVAVGERTATADDPQGDPLANKAAEADHRDAAASPVYGPKEEGASTDPQSPSPQPEMNDADNWDFDAREADGDQEPKVSDLCRAQSSDYMRTVLLAAGDRISTQERGTAGLAGLRDALAELALQKLCQPEVSRPDLELGLSLTKQVVSVQKQINQDYRLLGQMEKSV